MGKAFGGNGTKAGSACLMGIERQMRVVIHDPKHKSPNPRTFEILAAGSFVLTDEREYWGPLTPGKDVVGYENTEDLIAKLKLYLKDDAAREAIAANGRACVVDCMKTENLLRRILRGEDGEESRGR